MANERKTDFFIGKLLDGANIDYTPNGSSIKEIKDALKTSSKKKTGKAGFPEFVCKSKDFIIVIEDKADLSMQASYVDENNTTLQMDVKALFWAPTYQITPKYYSKSSILKSLKIQSQLLFAH